jgi:methyl-accepting chemotaxis protein
MIEERIAKVRAVGQSALGIAAALENQVVAGTLTREGAIERFREAVNGMRYEGGAGYVVMTTTDGTYIAKGDTPAAMALEEDESTQAQRRHA